MPSAPPRWLLFLVLANTLFLALSLAAGLAMSRSPLDDLGPDVDALVLERRVPAPAAGNCADLVVQAGQPLPHDLGKIARDWKPGAPRPTVLETHRTSLELLRRARGLPFALEGRSTTHVAAAGRLLALAARVDLAEGRFDEAAGRIHDGLSFAVRAMWDPKDTYLGAALVRGLVEPLREHPDALSRMSPATRRDLLEGLEQACLGRTSVEQVHLATWEESADLPFLLVADPERASRKVVLAALEPLRRRDFGDLRRLKVQIREAGPGDSPGWYLAFFMRRGGALEGLAALFTPAPADWAPGRLAAEFDLDALRVLLDPTLPRPEDPFAPGRPLQSRDGLVWSVGPDGVDEGARPLEGRVTARSRGDLVLP